MHLKTLWGKKQRGQVPDSDDLAEVKLVVVDLGDKNGCHSLVQRSAVHVDGGSHGQHEANDPPVYVVVLQQALEGDRQSGRTANEKHLLLKTPNNISIGSQFHLNTKNCFEKVQDFNMNSNISHHIQTFSD